MDFVETIAMNVIRSFFNNSIKKFNDQDLRTAIKENRDLWDATPGTIMNYASLLKKRFGNLLPKYINQITTDLMLNEWLSKDRPEFAMQIKTLPGGYQWFDAQVIKIKKKILEM